MFTPLLLALLSPAQAADGFDAGASIGVTGRVGIHDCVSDPGGCTFIHFRDAALIAPWVEASPSSALKARAQVDLRYHGPTEAARISEAQDPALVQPWSLRIRDGWVATRGEYFDLSLGVQRTAWGVANGLSVVDTLNPMDLEDPTQFDRRLSTPSAVATVHGGWVALTGVVQPFFIPAALPEVDTTLMAGATDVFDAKSTGGETLAIGTLDTRAEPPANTLANAQLAARLRLTPAIGDFSFSWMHGRDSLPQVDGDVVLVGYQTDDGTVDVGVPLTYPKIDVGGFTGRGEIGADITAWTEIALVLPAKTQAQASAAQLDSLVKLGTLDAMPDPIPVTVTQDGQPFARWIVGLERPFGPVRINLQWLRGFFTERTADDLKDYGLLGLRWGISPTVRLDLRGASDGAGGLGDAAISWLHADALEFTLGTTWIDGPDNSAFAGLAPASNTRLGATIAF